METVTLEFNSQQLSVISDALVNLPYRMSAPVIDAINMQILQQQAAEEANKNAGTGTERGDAEGVEFNAKLPEGV